MENFTDKNLMTINAYKSKIMIFNKSLTMDPETKGQMNDLEKMQEVARKIILFEDYRSYDLACALSM